MHVLLCRFKLLHTLMLKLFLIQMISAIRGEKIKWKKMIAYHWSVSATYPQLNECLTIRSHM